MTMRAHPSKNCCKAKPFGEHKVTIVLETDVLKHIIAEGSIFSGYIDLWSVKSHLLTSILHALLCMLVHLVQSVYRL
jgi:hypothetical protein